MNSSKSGALAVAQFFTVDFLLLLNKLRIFSVLMSWQLLLEHGRILLSTDERLFQIIGGNPQPALLKVNKRNNRTRCGICSKLTIMTSDAIGVVMVSLLLILNIFHTLF